MKHEISDTYFAPLWPWPECVTDKFRDQMIIDAPMDEISKRCTDRMYELNPLLKVEDAPAGVNISRDSLNLYVKLFTDPDGSEFRKSHDEAADLLAQHIADLMQTSCKSTLSFIGRRLMHRQGESYNHQSWCAVSPDGTQMYVILCCYFVLS